MPACSAQSLKVFKKLWAFFGPWPGVGIAFSYRHVEFFRVKQIYISIQGLGEDDTATTQETFIRARTSLKNPWIALNLKHSFQGLEFEKNILKSFEKWFLVLEFSFLKLYCDSLFSVFLKLLKTSWYWYYFARKTELRWNHMEKEFLPKRCQGFCHDSLIHVHDRALKMAIFGREKPWKALNSINFCLYEPCIQACVVWDQGWDSWLDQVLPNRSNPEVGSWWYRVSSVTCFVGSTSGFGSVP